MVTRKAARRAAAAVVLAVVGALFLSCSADDGVVRGSSALVLNPGDIYGYVTGPYGAIEGATVTWVCYDDNTFLGSDDTDSNGYYYIDSSTWGSGHDTHDFTGTAVKTGYKNGSAIIEDYDHYYNYRRDFYLELAR